MHKTSTRDPLGRGIPWHQGHARRAAMLGLTALLGGYLLLATIPAAQAACETTGAGGGAPAGSAAAPDTGDRVVCTGTGLTDPVATVVGSSEVTIAIGDGTTETELTTDEDNEIAVTLNGGSTVTVNANATLTTTGAAAIGIYANGGRNTIAVNGGTISTSGNGSRGIRTYNSGGNAVAISAGTVSTSGDGADAVYTHGDKNSVTISGGTVSTSGINATGILTAGADNTVKISGGTVSTSGYGSRGLIVGRDNNTITMSGGTMSTTGELGHGIYLYEATNTTVTISGGTVSTTGEDARAVYVSKSNNTTVTIDGGTVLAPGTGGLAVKYNVSDGESHQLILGTEASITGGLLALGTDTTTGTVDLTLNGLGSAVFNDTIDGFTSLTKTESGTWTLNGDIVNSGDITVEDGLLALNGHVGSNATVRTGGALAGTGTLGDITFEDGSAYLADVGSAGFLDSTGNISINGDVTLNIVASNPLAVSLATPVAILSADGGVNGTFARLKEDLLFLDAALGYDANNVFLTLERNNVAFADFARTPNQKATANGIDTRGAGKAFNALAVLESEDEARAALDQLSGEAHASLQSGLVQDSGALRGIVNTRLRGGVGGSGGRVQSAALGATPPAPRAPRSEAWIKAYGSFGRFEGDGNAADLTRVAGGVLLGLETEVAEDLRAGVLAGYGRSHVSADDRASEADTDSYTLGAYASRRFGPLRTQAGASFTWHRIDSARDVSFGGMDEEVSATYDARTYQAFGEVGYTVETPYVDLEPFAGLAVVYQETDGFTEDGGAAALSIDSSSQTLGVSTLGARATREFTLTPGGSPLSIDGALAWRHAFGDTTPETTARFAEGGNAFTVAGTPIDQDTLLVETGLAYDLSEDMTLSLGYRGEFGASVQDNGLNAKLVIRF